jgi:hypothetical protein
MKLLQTEESLALAAARSGMDEKTARKWRGEDQPPSQSKHERGYRTRTDSFAEVWREVEQLLEREARLEVKTIFEDLCRRYPDRFQPSHLRTLQRRVKTWRAIHGAEREVFFPQEHLPGRQAQSDFSHLTELNVTIAGQPFKHLFYHFALTYSNWEWGMICASESWESLSEGLQSALWELGGVPQEHRTDSLSAAVKPVGRNEFTDRYQSLLRHYQMAASHTTPGRGHENGDIEQSHHRFKRGVDQALMMRGGRNFASRGDYESYLRSMLVERNQVRQDRLAEEKTVLRLLPEKQLEAATPESPRVTRNSTISVRGNFYSVPSRLIGERVEVRVYGAHLEVWYAGQKLERIERLRGEGHAAINYRHVIHSLIRKPGAFAHYRYQACLFPRLIFRMAYDELRERRTGNADREYLELLKLAAEVSEDRVAAALRALVDRGERMSLGRVKDLMALNQEPLRLPRIEIQAVSLSNYDRLLLDPEVSA